MSISQGCYINTGNQLLFIINTQVEKIVYNGTQRLISLLFP